MLFYSHTISPRLKYITDFFGHHLLNKPFQLTTDPDAFVAFDGPKINYSNKKISASEYQISNSELLFEKGIKGQTIECFDAKGYKAFFRTGGDFSFDIFAAAFYLLSRYEEYLPHQKDIYGRYDHNSSLAFKENFLHLPLINVWMEDFRESLRVKFPLLTIHHPAFTFVPTYDIDEAFSYKYKQWWRTVGGIAKSTVRGQWSKIGERVNVLAGKQKDPFDSFGWIDQLNQQFSLNPYYFFLVAAKTGRYDKNILPSREAMKELIRQHGDRYSIGIHPSWQSGDDEEKLKIEISTLAHITGKRVLSSRQHFIRFTLPNTYRRLIDCGIEIDFSMGYGSINGFRASAATPFYWYDLEKEAQTKLLLHPFCYMEANSFFEQKFSPEQSLEELQHYYDVVRSVNGTLITIWHNTFLGTDTLFKGWPDTYRQFVTLVRS